MHGKTRAAAVPMRSAAAVLLTLAAALLLSGCLGWMAHPVPGYGPHHRWDDADGRPSGPGYRCTDEERAEGRPCPFRG